MIAQITIVSDAFKRKTIEKRVYIKLFTLEYKNVQENMSNDNSIRRDKVISCSKEEQEVQINVRTRNLERLYVNCNQTARSMN
jgi:hypothetical protein